MGICFHHYYAPKSSQRDQLKQIRDMGFEVINTEESLVEPATLPGPLPAVMAWNHIEIGQNKYDWSFHDHLVEDCAAVGLKLITDVFVPHHLPAWVAQKYGDTDVIAPNGRRWGHFRKQFCGTVYEFRCFSLAHEGAAAAAADFMGKLAARYMGSETVVGHNLFQELGLNWPHSNTWYGQDVSAPAVAGFEKYLRQGYPNLDTLNRDWQREYDSFAQAAGDPAIFRWDRMPHRGWQHWIDYRRQYVARFFRGMHDAVKAADPEALTAVSEAGDYHYSIMQGLDIGLLGFVDMVAGKSFGDFGEQDQFRWMFSHLRVSGTNVAVSNMNTMPGLPDITPSELARRILAAIAMGSKWNSLYSWHFYTHLDEANGVRVVHDNLKDFAPWMDFLRERRPLFTGAEAPKAEVAVLDFGRSDMIDFWRMNDPRTGYRSHVRRNAYAGSSDMIDFTRDFLGGWSVRYDILPRRRVLDGLKDYKLLIVGEPCLDEPLAGAIQAWVSRGGKLVLLPNAARFDEHGNTVDWFGEKLPQQNIMLRVYRDYIGWEKDAGFPTDASILLLERLDSLQVDDILKWAGVEPVLRFVDPPPPPVLMLGTCREAEAPGNFYWRDHVSAYSLDGLDGKRIYVLVQRGKETGPVKDLSIAWSSGAVTLYLPPGTEPVKVAPTSGKLVLPAWQDVAIIVC
jgi:hypothetical protein